MDFLKAEIERKKRQLEESKIIGPEKKYFKRGELSAKQREEYLKLHAPKVDDVRKKVEEIERAKQEAKKELLPGSSAHDEESTLSRSEVIRRLRERCQPILIFGETETKALERLRELETQNHDTQDNAHKITSESALAAVDKAYLDEIHADEGRASDAKSEPLKYLEPQHTYDELVDMSTGLDRGDVDYDYKIVSEFIKVLLSLWKKEIDERPESLKLSVKGKMELGTYKQTISYLKPLMRMIKKETVSDDIRDSLVILVKHTLQRDYILANETYMEMAIGNAPWPIGVTNAGIHARPGREKIFSKNVAHVLNDELQRKYIQALKRLITKAQQYYPTDPSRSIDYVRNDSQ